MELPLDPIPAQLVRVRDMLSMFNLNCSFWKMQRFLCAWFPPSGKSTGHYPSATRASLSLNCPQPSQQESLPFLHGWPSCCCVCSRQGAMPTPQRRAEACHLWDEILSILKLSIQYGASAPCQCPVQHIRCIVYFLCAL